MRGPVSQRQTCSRCQETVGEWYLGGATADTDAGCHVGAWNSGRWCRGIVARWRAAVYGYGPSVVTSTRSVPYKWNKRCWKFDAVAHANARPHCRYGPVVSERGRIKLA